MSNFRPETSGRQWSLVQVRLFGLAVGREGCCRQMSLACVGSTHNVPATLGLRPLTGVCFPGLHCSGSRLLYMERALYCMRFQFLGSPQKRGLGWACVLFLPRPSSSGSQEFDGRTLPGCGVPSPLRGPSLSFGACQSGACACVYSWELASSRNPPSRC